MGENVLVKSTETETKRNIYEAICNNDVACIKTYETKLSNAELDKLLSACYRRAYDSNIPVSMDMRYYVESTLISCRFHPIVSDNAVQRKNNVNHKETIEYLRTAINRILEYDQGIDDYFLYLVRIAVFVGNMAQHLVKGLQWTQFLFFLERFVNYFTDDDEDNMLYVTYITKDKLLQYVECFKVEFEQKLKPPTKATKIQIEAQCNKKTVDELISNYYDIRDICTLQRLNRYLTIWNDFEFDNTEKNKIGYLCMLRTLQVLGENFKNTPGAPNMSTKLKEWFAIFIDDYTLTLIIKCRDLISHLKTIPTIDEKLIIYTCYDVLRNFSHILHYVFLVTKYERIQNIQANVDKACKNKNYDRLEIPLYFKLVLCNNKNTSIVDYFNTLLNKYTTVLCKAARNISNVSYANILQDIYHEQRLRPLKPELIGRVLLEMNHCIYNSDIYKEWGTVFDNIITNISLEDFGNNTPVQCAVEMATIITLERLKEEKLLNDNRRWFNEECPTLGGVPLRNHLAHNNLLVRMVPLNDTITLYKNALLFVQYFKQWRKQKPHIKVGQNKSCSMIQLYERNDQTLTHLSVQIKLWNIIESGKTEMITETLSSSKADLKAVRSTDRQRAIHIAAQTSTQGELFKLIDKGAERIKDGVGRTILHIAVSSNSSTWEINDILKKMTNLDVLSRDNEGRTALDIAAVDDKLDIFITLLLHIKQFSSEIELTSKLQQICLIAAEFNSIEVMKYILEIYHKKINFNYQDDKNQKQTALHLAAKKGNQEIITLLFKTQSQKMNIRIQDENGFEAIHTALQFNQLNIFVQLMQHYGNIHVDRIQTLFEETCLHISAKFGNINGVNKLLIKYGADVNITNNISESALLLSSRQGFYDIVKILIEAKADIDVENAIGNTALLEAAKNGFFNVVKLLVENGANANIRNLIKCTPLMYAAEYGHLEIVRILIEANVDVNAVEGTNQKTALHWSAERGSLGIVKLLVESGANVNMLSAGNWTPLLFAAKHGHLDIVRILIEAEADVNAVEERKQETALHWAAQEGFLDVAKFLVDNGANVNMPNAGNGTPLLLAAENGHLDIVRILLEAGADVNAVDETRQATAIHWATGAGFLDVVMLLIHNGANVNMTCKNNLTPMHFAALAGFHDIARILIKANADVNAVEETNQRTALHVAAKEGFLDVVKLLVASGANVNLPDKDSCTPLHYAKQTGHLDIVKILIDAKTGLNKRARVATRGRLANMSQLIIIIIIISFMVLWQQA